MNRSSRLPIFDVTTVAHSSQHDGGNENEEERRSVFG